MQIRKNILKLALPVLLEQTLIMSMGVINTMMASNIGKEAVSAIGMVDSLNNILIAFFSALAVGGTVVVAQLRGRGNVKLCNEAAKQTLYAGLFISFVITILTWIFKLPLIKLLYGSADPAVMNNAFIYLGITILTYPFLSIILIGNGVLRGAGEMRTPMYATIIMNVINIILSYIFIYGLDIKNVHFHILFPSLGVKGAALGIALSRVLGSLFILFVLMRGSKSIKLKKIHIYRPNKELLKSILNIGIPASVESLLFNIGKLITQIFIVTMGTASIAANSITNSILGMANIPGNALSIAATIIVGQYVGKGKISEARNELLYITKFTAVCMFVPALLCALLSVPLSSMYTNSDEIINLSRNIIWLNLVFVIAWPISIVLPAGLKGAGDAKYTMIISVTSMWLFRIATGYILGVVLRFGIVGIWLAMYLDWLVRGSFFYKRVKGDKWETKVLIKKERGSKENGLI
jgi:putative MATE family efflux protein